MNYNLAIDRTTYSINEIQKTNYPTNEIQYARIQPQTSVQIPVAKRAFDIVFTMLILLLVLSWVLPLVSLLICLESRGPVFFKQLRTGKDGKPFYCFKFRSMHLNDEAHYLQATRGDARITKVGAWLRKTNIDEMPQFLNVLKGEMSVVGPRPHMLKHTEQYIELINNFMYRHTVLPGITGLAQVRGLRGETKEVIAMAHRVRIDSLYIRRSSLGLDLKIVFLTVKQAFLGHENAC